MTKKSAARIARDNAAKEQGVHKTQIGKPAAVAAKKNMCWDDLTNIHKECTMLLLSHAQLTTFTNNSEIMSLVEDTQTMSNNISMLARDIEKMSSELAEINAQHKDKVGGTEDPDEVMQSIAIFEQYHLFMERHQAVVMPTAYHIIEEINKADIKLRAQKSVTDPTVVTDVQPKEVSATVETTETTA